MFRTLWHACRGWSNDNASFLGAALAYYSLFSIAPLLLIAIGIAGLAFGEAAAKGQVFEFLKDYVGEASAKSVEQMVVSSRKPSFNSWPSIVATAILIYAALTVFRQLKTALNLVWKLPPIDRSGIGAFIIDTLLAIVLLLCTGIFIIFLTTASMLSAYISQLQFAIAIGPWAWQALDFAVITILQVLILGFTFRMLSEGRIPYRHVWGGAIVAALLLTAGKSAFSIYLSYSHLDTIYGAAGSIVVFLVWIYYSAQIVFFGAEVVKATMANGKTT